MKNVIIFTYLQRHLIKMFPIIAELQNNRQINLTVLLMTQEEQSLAIENHIEYKMLDEFTANIRQYDFDLGWGLEPLINAIDQIKPNIFLAIEVNYILRNAVRYCKQNGIKTIILQHGTPNRYSLHAFVPFEGDLFLAWGDFSKEFLVKNNMPPEKIILTGGVSFDRTLTLIPNKHRIAQTLNLNPHKKWILFTTQGSGSGSIPTPKEIRDGVAQTANSLKNNNEVQLIYQVHPSQKMAFIRALLRDIPSNNYVVCKYKDTEELIKSSDAMITFFSTTAIDAILLKKPLLLINLSEDKDFLPLPKMGVAIGVYDAKDISLSIENLLTGSPFENESYDRAIKYLNYKNDGKALQRVMDIIYDNIGV